MIEIREATLHDNTAILRLTKRTPMRGVIALRIDRDPDFFGLLRMRGPGKVFVAVVAHHIVGCISVAYESVFIDGKPHKVGYIDDLKIDPMFQGRLVAFKLVQALLNYIRTETVDLYFCLVAQGNESILPFLRGRLGLPKFEEMGKFFIYEMLPLPTYMADPPYEIGMAREGEYPEICQLVNDFNRSYQFAPLLTAHALPKKCAFDEVPMRVFTARKSGTMRATLSTCDMGTVKQNVVMGMPTLLRTIVGTIRIASKALPLWTLPRIGEAVKILYVRHMACADGHQRALRVLLQHVCHEAMRQKYSFVVLGLHERDRLQRLVRGMPKFTFVSHGFAMNLSQNQALLANALAGTPRLDFALV